MKLHRTSLLATLLSMTPLCAVAQSDAERKAAEEFEKAADKWEEIQSGARKVTPKEWGDAFKDYHEKKKKLDEEMGKPSSSSGKTGLRTPDFYLNPPPGWKPEDDLAALGTGGTTRCSICGAGAGAWGVGVGAGPGSLGSRPNNPLGASGRGPGR